MADSSKFLRHVDGVAAVLMLFVVVGGAASQLGMVLAALGAGLGAALLPMLVVPLVMAGSFSKRGINPRFVIISAMVAGAFWPAFVICGVWLQGAWLKELLVPLKESLERADVGFWAAFIATWTIAAGALTLLVIRYCRMEDD